MASRHSLPETALLCLSPSTAPHTRDGAAPGHIWTGADACLVGGMGQPSRALFPSVACHVCFSQTRRGVARARMWKC